MRIDLHTHSAVSDGTDTPTRLVLNAVTAGLDVIGLTDHDTFDGVAEAVEAAKRVGIKVMPGMEMSTEVQGHSVHLLVYGADPYHLPLVEELARIRVGRTGRLAKMADKLTALGYPITLEDISTAAGSAPSVGRPHVADAMVAKGYVATRDEAFAKFLDQNGPGYVSRYAPSLEDAIDLAHDARGIAILAHPWGRDGLEVLPAEYLQRLVNQHSLEGIEVDHQDHDRAKRELLFDMGARMGLLRTGGSDYHGAGKVDHALGCNLTRESAFREMQRRIKLRGGQAISL